MDHYLPAVARALALIEERLTAPVTLAELARRAGFSLWHFQRIFAAYVGEPAGSYLRRRRLTAAAGELRAAPRRLLDLALDYQFESHAAFTRAFTAMHGTTPSAFRRHRRLPWVQTRPPLRAADLARRRTSLAMKPTIIKSPALRLAGLEAPFFGPLSPDANNHRVIPALFAGLEQRRAELPPARDAYTYGASDCLPEKLRGKDGDLAYLAGIRVAPRARVPRGLQVWRVPARTYACFRHRGPIRRIDETMNHIFGTWLPRSGYDPADGPTLERYGPAFGDGGEGSEMEILVPVRRRRRAKA